MKNDRIDFVLPVALTEQFADRAPQGTWRSSANDFTPLRLHLMVSSFLLRFEQDDLGSFCLVCPAKDVAAVARLLATLTRDARYCVVPERELSTDLADALEHHGPALPGWRIQQLIKLVFHERTSRSHYLTLDNDIICLRPFSGQDLLIDNRCVTGTETTEDYRRLYSPEFAPAELGLKTLRYRKAATLLGYERPAIHAGTFFSETPVLLARESVAQLVEHLRKRLGHNWATKLALHRGWTEYGLYFQFLEMTGQLATVCAPGHCNALLDLDKSVWQLSENYNGKRIYDREHFFSFPAHRPNGLFAAIQSWLPVAGWLPAGYDCLDQFYGDLQAWMRASVTIADDAKGPAVQR